MHRNPTVTQKSLKFFCYIALAAFCWEWFPTLIFPMLGSLPLICYMGHGSWIAYILGSGYYGFGLLDISLDWNYVSFFSPLYTPLWANANVYLGAMGLCWFIYPIMYFTNALNALNFAPMSSGTWDNTGNQYNISRIMTPQFTLNQTAMDDYSKPYWSASYAMYFFCGFAASTGALLYSCLWYGKEAWDGLKMGWFNKRDSYDDPYLKLMEHLPRVPHWWYALLLAVCTALSLGQLYGAGMQLPWW